jgi:hypothetical protein
MRNEANSGGKTTIKVECETKRVALDPRVPDKTILIAQNLSLEEEVELLSFLDKYSDVFAWTTFELTGLSRSIIEQKLHVNPSAKTRKQKPRKMSDENDATTKADLQRLQGG